MAFWVFLFCGMSPSEVANRGSAKPPKFGVGCMKTGDDRLPSLAACAGRRPRFVVTVESLTVRLLLSAAVRFGPAGIFRADEVSTCSPCACPASTLEILPAGEARHLVFAFRYCHLRLTSAKCGVQCGLQCSVKNREYLVDPFVPSGDFMEFALGGRKPRRNSVVSVFGPSVLKPTRVNFSGSAYSCSYLEQKAATSTVPLHLYLEHWV